MHFEGLGGCNENTDPENSDSENSDPENSDPCKFNSLQFLSPKSFNGRLMLIGNNRSGRDIYLFRFIAVAPIKTAIVSMAELSILRFHFLFFAFC